MLCASPCTRQTTGSACKLLMYLGQSPQSLWRLQVRKLQQALAATEAFPVADSHEVPVGRTGSLRYGGSPFFGHSRSTGDGSSLGNGLAALSQPFKLRLAAASHEKQLVDYSVNVVRLSSVSLFV